MRFKDLVGRDWKDFDAASVEGQAAYELLLFKGGSPHHAGEGIVFI